MSLKLAGFIRRSQLKGFSALRSLARPFRQDYGWLTQGSDHFRLEWSGRLTFLRAEEQALEISVPDPILPGQVQVHYFRPRSIWRVTNLVYSPKTGVSFLNGFGVEDSIAGSATKRRQRFRKWWSIGKDFARPVIGVGQRRQNYYHWLIEDLPWVLRAQEEEPRVLVVLPARNPNYVYQSLDYYGLEYREVQSATRCQEGIMPSRGHDSGWPHPSDIQRLRQSRPERKVQPGRRLYVSRRFSSRAFENEQQVELFLRKKGFEIVFLEDHSFREQAQMFAEASIVVGGHGAGLSNLVFAQEGSRVVEISLANHSIPCFELIANEVGMAFQRLVVEARGRRTGSVPLDALAATVDQSGFQTFPRSSP